MMEVLVDFVDFRRKLHFDSDEFQFQILEKKGVPFFGRKAESTESSRVSQHQLAVGSPSAMVMRDESRSGKCRHY